MQAGRSETAQMLYLMHLLEFHPRISIGRSHFISRFPAMYSGCGSTIASHLSTAARYVSEGRSCRPGWDGIASFLIEPNFAGSHLDDRNQDAPINNLDWRSTPFANCIHWDRRPTSRSGRSRDRRLQRPTRDTAHPSVCGRRSGPLAGYQNVAPHESNLPYLRRIKAAGWMV